MKQHVDTAHRSFLTLVGLGLVPYLMLGLVGCGLGSVIFHRIQDGGFGALSAGPGDLRPALAVNALLAVSSTIALWSIWRQVRATRDLASRVRLRRRDAPDELAAGARAVGLGRRVDYVVSEEPFSFVYGLVRPRVVVSGALVDTLDAAELRAVLEHERYHVRHFDPLKIVVARVFAAAAFFLPAIRGLQARYGATSELAADRRAVRVCGRGPLAGALYRSLRGPSWGELSTAAALGGAELLDVRVAQLESGEEPAVAPVSRLATAATGLVLVVLAGALGVASVNAGVGDLVGAWHGSGEHSHGADLGLHDLLLLTPLPLLAAAKLRARRRGGKTVLTTTAAS